MKKVFFTLALALGLGLAASAQEGGLFGYGPQRGGVKIIQQITTTALVAC